MGWKGTLRTLQAAQRRSEREALRRQRELEKRRSQVAKMQELERTMYEVQVYENRLDLLLSVHKECGEPINWQTIKDTQPPTEPSKSNVNEDIAQAKLEEYKPSMFDKVLKRTNMQQDRLMTNIKQAIELDEEEYRTALLVYQQNYNEWETKRDLANRVLAGDPQSYLDVIQTFDPFTDVGQLGSKITFEIETSTLISATLHVNGEQVVPSEVRTLLKTGKLSVKPMTKSRFYELYQDYVCSCVLRIANELFAILPIEMVIVTALGALLNTRIGYKEKLPVLSAVIPRKTLEELHLDKIDPSDSMHNFVHRMSFKRSKGFEAVEAIEPQEILGSTHSKLYQVTAANTPSPNNRSVN